MGEIPIVTTIQAWTEFDGLKVPSKMSMSMMGQQQLIEFDSMSFDPITPETFDFPPAIKALIADQKAREAEAKESATDVAAPADPTSPSKSEGSNSSSSPKGN